MSAAPDDARADGAEPDGAEPPTITLITPSYNQGRYLEATIRSVLLQRYPKLEYFIMDGGSTDESVEIIRRYAHRLTHWESGRDRGQAHAINKGFARAGGEVVGWLNSDDLLLPGALHAVAGAARSRPDAVAWVGACYRVDPRERLLSVVEPRGLDRDRIADWGRTGFFYQPSCFFWREALETAGPLDEELHYSFDHDLWLRLAALGPFAAIDRVLSAATVHPDAKTRAHRSAMHAETVAVQIRHGYREAAVDRIERVLEQPRLRELVRRYLVVKTKGLLGTVVPGLRDEPPTLRELLERNARP